MADRRLLNHFNINNPIYGMARVSVWLVDPVTFLATQVLATLYSDPWLPETLGNPVILTGQGRWPQPVYVDALVMIVASPAKHETGQNVLGTWLANNPPPPSYGNHPVLPVPPA